jgi:hypothetical protein
MNGMRKCLFCELPLNNSNRAKEHVLRNSWLRNLGHQKTHLDSTRFSSKGAIGFKKFPADQLQAGEVCRRCNNGWMNSLDLQVESVIMKLAAEPKELPMLHSSEKLLLGRWLLKTAATYEYTDGRDRRHIPNEMLKCIREVDFLPPGFLVVIGRPSTPQIGVGIGQYDMWRVLEGAQLALQPQSTRLKFGVQYNNILLACCYVQVDNPVFYGIAGLHFPVFTSDCEVRLLDAPNSNPDYWVKFPDGVSPSVLTFFLLTLGIWIPQYGDIRSFSMLDNI